MAYIPGNENLDRNSLDVSAKYSVGTEFDYHNRFPRDQAKITKDAFTDTRPFIISSGSVASQGQFGASFNGNNYSTEQDMKQSVHDLYMSNIYGMPFSGSDVCGYHGKSNNELCTRWYMLAAVQPFSRNGASLNSPNQGPYDFTGVVPDHPSVTIQQAIMYAMNVKYNILRYMVSFFHGIKTTGGAYYKPLFFDYPNDLYAYEYLDQNTMLGESIKFSFNPSMSFTKEAKFYFPEGRWCQLYPEEKEKNPC